MPGIVHQDAHIHNVVFKLVVEFLCGRFLLEVLRNHRHLDLVRSRESGREGAKFGFHRRYKHKRMAVPGELVRKMQPDSARSSSYQRTFRIHDRWIAAG
jgi:hypothetical protein